MTKVELRLKLVPTQNQITWRIISSLFLLGVVSVVGDENSSQKVKILRNTGATQSLMLDSVCPLQKIVLLVQMYLFQG